ncbi:hypothetical protein ACFFUT_03310 [Pseudohalocynthiibacter aestuariivivens]|uniref:Uncharacterized protein n=1 Tax=Pseudohalocynthiibacter aestuariivivens TaxID=1591409 RepID=A0ABV5JBI4_9RHOB|nr:MULTISPECIES: hypothetical protein [Pseudohalocynthiibacter]MBS9715627.1 hypothetical protein [Pseudohalocynthiibacter aestuariivivens]MCK0101241.1 hypothetical protein [Pseudohalocynthiibacter sp. F2068]
MTLRLEIGYRERITIADQMHVVDWVYSPSGRGNFSSKRGLRIEVILPGYRPIHGERPPVYLRLNLAKGDNPWLMNNHLLSKEPVGPDEAVCVEDIVNRYCRFATGGAWYIAHHQVSSGVKEHLYPSLDQLRSEVSALFDTFIEVN